MKRSKRVEESLPDEVWIRILETGIKSKTLTPKDICSFSTSCKHFYQVSVEDVVWLGFLSLNFRGYPNYEQFQTTPLKKKSLYKCVFNRFKKLMCEYESIEDPIMELFAESDNNNLAILDSFYKFCAEKFDNLERRMDIFKELASMVHGITDREGKYYLSGVVSEDITPPSSVQKQTSSEASEVRGLERREEGEPAIGDIS